MKKQLVKIVKLTSIFLVANLLFLCQISAPVLAANDCSDICNPNCNVPDDIKAASGCNGGTDATLQSAVVYILNGIIGISGLIAVIYVIIGALTILTSSGDSTKVQKGRNTILYACIGLAVCALAFALVNFVITQIIP